MKPTNRIAYALFLMVLAISSYQCSSSKEVAFQAQPEIQVDEIVFQEWYAGIKVGGTGYNIFLPNLTSNQNVTLERVYFRNLSGELVQEKGMYTAVLANNSPYYTWEYPEKPEDYPFDLKPNECVVSYTENGTTKFVKVANLLEKAGTYYENGHPAVYQGVVNTILAEVEKD